MEKSLSNIIENSLYDEVRLRIINESKINSHEVYHITCEGEPVDTFETEEIAMNHLNIYKKKHPEKEFIIEKKTYNSPSEMIDKLDEMSGDEDEKTEIKKMKKVKVKSLEEATSIAKQKNVKKFKFNGNEYNLNDNWVLLEEEKNKCNECKDEPTKGNKKNISESLTEKGIEKIKNLCDSIGHRPTAIKLVDLTLSKIVGITSSDLGDSSIFADGLDEIETFLEDGDYQMAYNVAKNVAKDMLEDEGYPMGMEEKLVNNQTKPHKDDTNTNESEVCECGGELNEEGMCNECGTGRMEESKKTKLRLTESELVSLIKKMVEKVKINIKESTPGLEITSRVKNANKKENDSNIKNVEEKLKKISTFDGNDNPEFPKQINKGEKTTINNTEKQDEIVADNRGGGLEDLDYDYEPSEEFKKRLKMSLTGDSKMGNSQDAANVIKTNTGQELDKKIVRKKEKQSKDSEVSWGHMWKTPIVVNEKKSNKMTDIIEEEVERMKRMIGYDERTQ
jgi:hypothetical protein